MKRRRSCSWPFKTIRAIRTHIAFSPRAMPIWAGSTKRARSSPGCAPLPLWSCRTFCRGATRRTVSSSCRVYAWRWVSQHEADRLSALLCRHHDPGMAAFLEPARPFLLGLGPPPGLARDFRDRLPLRARGVDHPALRDLHSLRGLYRPRADRNDPAVQRDADLAVDGL